ncbi:MAG: membrane protein insertion efficiency factor YidD [Thermodesulfobacteriota bacterium]|nr:membrane protein insertion efficiency factor YidD [Thermodesulfobacteriota bacterium]
MLFKVLAFILLFIGLPFQTLSIKAGYAEEGRFQEPWENSFSRAGKKNLEQEAFLAQRAVEGLVGFFKNYISPVDGDRCPSYPSCSQYALEAVRKHGALVGLVMAFGRLLHESDEIYRAPLIKINDSFRYYDPVENNDFWWDKKIGNR